MAKIAVVDVPAGAADAPKRGRRRNGTSDADGAAESRQTGRQGLDTIIWRVCDILRRSAVTGALQYVPELTWMLFLRILDDSEENEAAEARAVGSSFTPSLAAPYRWRDWAAPDGPKRVELTESGALGSFFQFVTAGLLPHLHGLGDRPSSSPRQRIISQIMSGVQESHVDTEKNLLDVLDKLHEIRVGQLDPTHMFALSQVYEGLLLKMGEKGNDGGQFFTPREIIRVMVRAVAPKVGETVYDPCCGTGGFLAQAHEAMRKALDECGDEATAEQYDLLGHRTFYGREKENLVYPIALSNLVLHGIDEPHIWHGNTLTGNEVYGGLYRNAPGLYDVILTNPPFGGKEGIEAQTNFIYKTSATQILFLQYVIDSLKPGGRCGIVVDEGVMFRSNDAFLQTKRKLLDDCTVSAIVSLPGGVFTAAGAGVKTNLLFFERGGPTESVWYYDLSDVKVGKKTPLTAAHFDDFFRLLPTRGDSDRSWTVTRAEIEAKKYDLKAVNPNARAVEDTRTPAELLDLIEAKGREVADAVTALRALMSAT